jgi:3-methyl-2-oxobutanoate hydroxymethyltransferase
MSECCNQGKNVNRVTAVQVRDMKGRGEKFAMLTAYDFPTACIMDQAGIPLILVGDSLGMVVLGYDSTIPVTMEDMVHHTRAVARGATRAMVVADMPFLSYHLSLEQALGNAGRLIQEGGAQAVKLEGGLTVADRVKRMVDCGIPVMGHIGLTPQSIHQFGGYKAQGKTLKAAKRLIEDALALEEAGVFAIVLETVPAELAVKITATISVPTIGIGAGAGCDGQVQVVNDILGLCDFVPRHARQYANVSEVILKAVNQYKEEVRTGAFPTSKESLALDPAVLQELNRMDT